MMRPELILIVSMKSGSLGSKRSRPPCFEESSSCFGQNNQVYFRETQRKEIIYFILGNNIFTEIRLINKLYIILICDMA